MDHAVILHLKLSDEEFGTLEEREVIFKIEDALSDAVRVSGVGECDGHEFGAGFGTIFLYGPDAEKLRGVAERVLVNYQLAPGSFLRIRRGGPGSEEERVEFR